MYNTSFKKTLITHKKVATLKFPNTCMAYSLVGEKFMIDSRWHFRTTAFFIKLWLSMWIKRITYVTLRIPLSSYNPCECITLSHVLSIVKTLYPTDLHDFVARAAAGCHILLLKWKHLISQPPLSKSWYCTPHCFPVGAPAEHSPSHLIMALKAKSNCIITLSVADDWDLQRLCSASVPVHLTGRGCRLIKGVQNIVTQQPRFSQTTAHNQSGTDTANALPLTGVTLLLPGWCNLPSDQGETVIFNQKCPLCQMTELKFRDEGTDDLHCGINLCIFRTRPVSQHQLVKTDCSMIQSSTVLQQRTNLSAFDSTCAWPLITHKVITRQRQWKHE